MEKTIILTITLVLSAHFTAAHAQGLQIQTCSYVPGFVAGPSPIIGLPEPSLTDWEMTLLNYFNQTYRNRIPALPLLTLHNEPNARAGTFGVAINRQWMSSMGKAMGTAIFAHELGHVCQGYNLLPIDPAFLQYGLEGQADYFAGRLLAASAFPVHVFENEVVPFLARAQGSSTHPPGPIRVMLTKAGFYHRPNVSH